MSVASEGFAFSVRENVDRPAWLLPKLNPFVGELLCIVVGLGEVSTIELPNAEDTLETG